MTNRWLIALTLVGVLGSGLVAGAFFAFSAFVMRAIARLPAHEGVAAMQSINVVVINPLFMGVFLGTALASALAVGAGWMRWGTPGAAYWVAGGLLYLVGTFLVTMAFNVPLNNALAAVSPSDADAASGWADYVRRWTAWNHVRTVAALLATAAFAMALRRR